MKKIRLPLSSQTDAYCTGCIFIIRIFHDNESMKRVAVIVEDSEIRDGMHC
mgnify:CR=1 FL=1